MYVVNKNKSGVTSLPAKEISLVNIGSLGSKLAQDILKIISEKPIYPKEIARRLKVNEQKIYYHIRNLEKAKIIEIIKKETMQGAVANYYVLKAPAFIIKFKDYQLTQKLSGIEEKETSIKFLEPFIEEGRFNSTIITGSPDPHGPEKARSRDGYYGMDFALFLGTFLNYVPDLSVKLDTEVRSEDLQNNLILFGGPVVNLITGKINNKLPIRFDKGSHWGIYSSISDKLYSSDEIGIIVKIKNPFNPKKYIMVIAGKRYAGTKAAIISFLKYFKEISKGNNFNKNIDAKVIEGIDLDSDGIVDDVEILE
ncbi:MAG: S-layer protein [Candidatus Nanoarchaeia archaeon]|nr:S-layer protein [Candidatus Nanoarchaeia archaeon]